MRKKLTALILVCMLAAALTACGSGSKKNGTLHYTLPDGFTEQSEGSGQYVTADYPNDSSNIIIQETKDDPYGADYTEEQFTELVAAAYEAQGYTIDSFNINEFTKKEMSGFDTLMIDCTYSLMGIEIEQIEFLAKIGDTTHVITYTTSPNLGWHDAFRESVDTITID